MATWANAGLEKYGYVPDNSMQGYQAQWQSWFDCSSNFYKQVIDNDAYGEDRYRLTMKPARMVADEMATLVLPEGTIISSTDEAMNEWIDDRFNGFIDESVEFLSRVYATGAGAWALGLKIGAAGTETYIQSYDAQEIIPLIGGGCAFTSLVNIEGKRYKQLQIHALHEGTFHIFTHLFDDEDHEVSFETVAGVVNTGQTMPTFTIVRPARSNTINKYSPLGCSIYEDAIGAFKMVDESFNELYWHTRLSRPRVFLDETMIARDKKTGAIDYQTTLDKTLFRAVGGGVGSPTPINVYNPETHIADMTQALNSALSIMSVKCGFGQGYFSFDFKQGLKTATEVVANNSQLYRNIKRHEKRLGSSIKAIIQAAFLVELRFAGSTLPETEVPQIDIMWDDSVMIDTEQERATMKDDIARGLCPAWFYPNRYYGLSENDSKELVGAAGEEDIEM